MGKHNPIFGTDLSIPFSETVEELRSRIAKIRGQLYDIGSAETIWKDRLQSVEGLLTCGLVSLYAVKEEMAEYERKWGHRRCKIENSVAADGISDL